MHLAHAQQGEDEQIRTRYERSIMTIRPHAISETAIQYLVWALEEIEKAGNQEAVDHVRIALRMLREGTLQSD